MNYLTKQYVTAFAALAMSFTQLGCQQAPPPTTVITPPATTTQESTTHTETQKTTPATVNADGTPATPEQTTTEKIASEDIVILGVNEAWVAVIRNRAGFPDGVLVSSVIDFKGLERKVVIIAADREIADEPELAYVSLSRPRTHLIVAGEPEILSWLGASDVST